MYDRCHDHDEGGRITHRARLDGRDGGAGRRALRRIDAAGRPELPDLRSAVPAPVHPRRSPSSSWRPPRRTAGSACSMPDVAGAIAAAAAEVADGAHDDQFPIDIYQTGSGTSTNTNMNEVVAHLAADPAGRARGPPQRRRQPLPELERRDPDGAPALGGDGDRGGADPGPRAAARRPRRQGSRSSGRS